MLIFEFKIRGSNQGGTVAIVDDILTGDFDYDAEQVDILCRDAAELTFDSALAGYLAGASADVDLERGRWAVKEATIRQMQNVAYLN